MGIKHADRISERLRQLREQMREDAEDDADDDDGEALDEFFAETREEPFFVKNLERVQGDERDAIILTIGYGKDPASGRMLYRFGPLLQDGGERRLNVAVTRAKQRMTVVSSFKSADLDPDKLNKDGPKLLRAYLAYAESRGSSLGERHELPPELNPFEIQVRDELVRAGVHVTAQHGVSGYRIDFAVKHPEQPGRYVLAIECDGVRYHSSPTARERDRLRQQHLELLGWRFCRIWSSDWFDDRPREMQRIIDAYHEAIAVVDGEESPDPFDDAASAPPPVTSPTAACNGNRPIVRGLYNPREIEALVRWVESDTLLRTRDELFWDTLRALGFERAGSRIRPAIESAIVRVRGPDPNPQPAASRFTSPASPEPRRADSINRPVPRPVRVPLPGVAGGLGPQRSGVASELRFVPAARIHYLPKNGSGAGSDRIINPLYFSGNLMWAWCHKRGDVRCFNTTRIAKWQPVDAFLWPVPAEAKEDAEELARSFDKGGGYTRRRRRR